MACDGSTLPAGKFAKWFANDQQTEWLWRENNCHDRACLVRWFAKRRAVLGWIAYSNVGLGDNGLKVVAQLDDNRVIIAVFTTAYLDNYLIDPSTLQSTRLPDGDIQVLSESPISLKISGKKSYLKGGGAIWFDMITDAFGNIIDLPGTTGKCVPKDQFSKLVELSADLSR